jgi:hypothetical protein
LDDQQIMQTFLYQIGRGQGAAAIMGKTWEQGSYLCVERRDPLATRSGKILHIHIQKEHTP